MTRTVLLSIVLAFFLTSSAFAKPGATGVKPYNFKDFINTKWVKDPQVSPDGKKVAFVIESKNLKENTITSAVWMLDIATKSLKQFTSGNKKDSHPRWSPDGRKIAFSSSRDGESQIWVIPSQGGEAKKITDLKAGGWDPEWSLSGNKILFLSEMYLGCNSEEENRKMAEEKEKSKVKAQLITELPYRVFDHWRENKRSHLFVIPEDGGKATDLTPGKYDIPPIDLGGSKDYEFSPDGKEVAYVTNIDPNLAWSTNNDVFTVPAQGGNPSKISQSKGCDSNPRYSPDGKYLAYTSMERAGFEADRRDIILYDRTTKKASNLTKALDRTIDDLIWSNDSKTIYFTAEDKGYKSIFKVDIATKKILTLTEKTNNSSISLTPDGKNIVFCRDSMTRPPEIYLLDTRTCKSQQITFINKSTFSNIDMNPPEEFWFKAKDGIMIQGFLVKPPAFDRSKKYPLVYLIHGGPQSSWGDDFHPRWNTELFAAEGYVVASINFRGSTGFGQQFTDLISKDWGGMPYQDVMSGVDYLLETYPYIDKDRLCAVGASYGGYMINWILGHTDRFKTTICHSGVFNLASKYGTTEELWFPEWEIGGTPYDNMENYQKWSPVNYVRNFKTPCLVIHGEQDYRVTVSEGMQLFTALKRKNIPSEFLYFPDECHFIRKPQNLEIWYKTMFDWMKHWLK